MKWVSVKIRLPELKKKVLTSGMHGKMRVNFLRDEYGPTEWDCENDYITHWMPLPKPAI